MQTGSRQLPWWTWLVPLFIFHIGTQLSVNFQFSPGVSLLYLPVPLGVALIQWWGPRVLAGLYLNAVFCAGMWGLTRWYLWPLYALPEVLAVGAAWFLFQKIAQGKCWLPNFRHMVRFILCAIIPAATIDGFVVPGQLVLFGDIPSANFAWTIWGEWWASMAGCLSISLPILILGSGFMRKRGLVLTGDDERNEVLVFPRCSLRHMFEIAGAFMVVVIVSMIPATLAQQWVCFACVSLWIALRFGVGFTSIINTVIVFMTFLYPVIVGIRGDSIVRDQVNMIGMHMQLGFICFITTIAGSMISTLRSEIEWRIRNEESLTKEKKRFRELFNNMRSAVAVYVAVDDGRDFVFKDLNSIAVRLEKVRKQDVIGKRISDVFPGVKDFGLLDVFRRVWKTGKQEEHPISWYKDDRIAGWRENTVFKLSSGEIVAVYSDVTKQKMAMDERDQLFLHSQDMLFVGGFDGYLKQLNPAWERTLGWTTQELCAKPWIEYVHPNDIESTIAVGKQLQQGKKVITFENRYKCKDGTYRWVAWNSSPFPDQQLIVGVARDVTEQKLAQEAITRSEERFRSLFESMAEGVCLHEVIRDTYGRIVNYRILDVNPAFERHTSIQRIHACGKLATELYGTTEPPYLDKYVTVFDADAPVSFESYFAPMQKHFQVSVVRITYDQFATVFENITERKQREKELHEKNIELERFAYSISHDLKSPIITIKCFLGYLKHDIEKGVSSAQTAEDFARITDAAARMEVMVNDLLELSRIGHVMKPSQPCSMDMIVADVVQMLGPQCVESNIKVTVHSPLPQVMGDKERLYEVVLNLVENAIKYRNLSRETLIDISATVHDANCVVSIKDNGIGIDPRYHAKIFGLFNKLDSETEGSGVGLALVKRTIELHGGKVWVESDGAGKGTTFFFSLPAVVPPNTVGA